MSEHVWPPLSESDIAFALGEGVRESHYLDLKRGIEATNGGNAELARDLASFAIDGGSILVGVAEDKSSRTWQLSPQTLAGLAERVELVARSKIDQPVSVRITEIPSAVDPAVGYLWIDIEPSAVAPHMAGGIYYGRGDQTKIRLSDAEVLRLHASRLVERDLADQLLDDEIAREPVPDAERQHGHIYLVAKPLTAPRAIARAFVRGDQLAIRQLVRSGDIGLSQDLTQFYPSLEGATTLATRARGVAISSPPTQNGRQWQAGLYDPERSLLDIEIGEDGGIRAVVGRLTDATDETSSPLVLDGLAVAYAWRLVSWARAVGDVAAYRGTWVFGVAGDRLHGSISSLRNNNFGFHSGPVYDLDTYRETTSATAREMLERPAHVVERLVGPLLRGLGTHHYWAPRVGFDEA